MVVKDREEKALTFASPEKLCEAAEEIRATLVNALREKKPGRAEAQAWADIADAAIDRAMDLLKLKEQYPPKQYPRLARVLAELAETANRAEDDLYRYGVHMKLPKYVG